MRRLALIFTIAGALLAGFVAGLYAARDDRAELMRLDREFDEAVARGGSVAWASYFAEDGILMPAGENMVVGRQAIQQHMAKAFAEPKFVLRWEPLGAEVSRDLGYTYGLYRAQRPGKDGQLATSHGKYVTIWRKQRGNDWKIAVDVGNASPPPSRDR